MAPVFSKHKPSLSIDSALHSLNSTKQDLLRIPSADHGPVVASNNAVNRRFQKLRGSIQYPPLTGIPPELHRKRYQQCSDTEESDEAEMSQPPIYKPAIHPDMKMNDSGPLLQREYAGGAKIGLSLDRTVHYRAAASAASAWIYHDSHNVSNEDGKSEDSRNVQPPLSLKSPPLGSESLRSDPFSDSAEIANVPRLLLSFTLEIEPNMKGIATGTRENFEFISISFDFWSTPVQSPYSEIQEAYSRTPFGRRNSLNSCDMPLVRGFSATDLAKTGFLRSFGSTLYSSLHKDGIDLDSVVLGAAKEHYVYKSFERQLSQLHKPVKLETDRIAARGSNDSNSAITSTPPSLHSQTISSTISNSASPRSPKFETPAYGTSSIRIMVKRDLKEESSWSTRSIPFVVMLEYSPSMPNIGAKVKLDVSTVRQALPGMNRRDSGDVQSRQSLMNGAYNSRQQRLKDSGLSSAASYAAAERKARFLDTPSEHEALVHIFPRRDALSVVSCGAGTVKDTLFPSAIKAPQPKAGSLPDDLPQLRKNNVIPHHSSPSFSNVKQIVTTPKPQVTIPPPSKPNYKHMHTKSAMIVPGQYKRTDSVNSNKHYAFSHGANVTRSRSDSSSNKVFTSFS